MREAASSDRTVTRVHASQRMFETAVDAVHVASLRSGTFCSLRQAVVAGLDQLLAVSRVDRLILLKGFQRAALSGERVFILSFNAQERRLLTETRSTVSTQTDTTLTIEETIMLSLIVLARDK